MKKYNYGISALLIVIAGLIIHNSLQMNESVSGTAMGPGVWPMILSVVLIILAVVQIVQNLLNKTGESEESPIDFKSSAMKRIYITAALVVVFAVLLKLLGFYISMAFLLVTVMLLLGEKRPIRLAAIKVGILAFIYVVFVLLLKLNMPVGLLFK